MQVHTSRGTVPVPAGPEDPVEETPVRRPRSARRTSSVDMLRSADRPGELVLVGHARDVTTEADGIGSVAGEAYLTAVLDRDWRLQELRTAPEEPATSALVATRVGAGFRRLVDDAVPTDRAAQSPLYLLLDDLPVAALISGYADLYLRGDDPPSERRATSPKADICSGWRSEGTMMVAIREQGRIPVPIGPPAPVIERDDDPLDWHPLDRPGPGGMRRRRRIDVDGEESLRVDAMFRDTHVDASGVETVLHEYGVEMTVDRSTLEVVWILATPRVLPWVECPWAAQSATRLVGQDVRRLRRFVRDSLSGTATCTHLNDLLRSLADVAPLAALASSP